MTLPKFHSRKSLFAGVVAGLALVIIGWLIMSFQISGVWLLVSSLYFIICGGVLAIHCVDMIRYYKKHRIIKIEKTDTHRIITKE